jgi:hypothetical protein
MDLLALDLDTPLIRFTQGGFHLSDRRLHNTIRVGGYIDAEMLLRKLTSLLFGLSSTEVFIAT